MLDMWQQKWLVLFLHIMIGNISICEIYVVKFVISLLSLENNSTIDI